MPPGYALILIFPVLAAVYRVQACAELDGSIRISAWDCAADQFKALALFGILGALKPWLWGWRPLALSSAMGALLSAIPTLAAGNLRGFSDAAFFAACGAIAGLACARLFFGAPGKASG